MWTGWFVEDPKDEGRRFRLPLEYHVFTDWIMPKNDSPTENGK